MTRVHAVVALALLILGVVVLNQYHDARVELATAKHEYVYQMCNDSRQEVSGTSEQACGDAQDRTHTEFLCAERNALPSNHCWVEDK
jgi:hypothetical protein